MRPIYAKSHPVSFSSSFYKKFIVFLYFIPAKVSIFFFTFLLSPYSFAEVIVKDFDLGVSLGRNGSRNLTIPLEDEYVSHTINIQEFAGIPETVNVAHTISNNILNITITDSGNNTYSNDSPGADIGHVVVFIQTNKQLSCEMGNTFVGNPISIPSGIKFESATDYYSRRNPLLKFERSYNSRDNKWYFNLLKKMVTDTIAVQLGSTIVTQKIYVFTHNDGSQYTEIVSPFSNGTNAVFMYKSSGQNRVTETAQEVIYNNKGIIEYYDAVTGNLKKIKSTENEVILSYQGNSITVAGTDGGFIKLVVNPNGNFTMTGDDTHIFQYQLTNGLLTKIIYPDNNAKTYVYGEDADYPDALTGMVDERGIRYATWGYDNSKRANLSMHANGAQKVDFDYSEEDVVIETNSLGKETRYYFQKIQGNEKIVRVEGVATNSCVATDSYYTYDSKGYRLTSTDPAGNVIETIRNDYGMIIIKRTGLKWSSGVGSSLIETPLTAREESMWQVANGLLLRKIYSQYDASVGKYQPYKMDVYTYDTDGKLLRQSVESLDNQGE